VLTTEDGKLCLLGKSGKPRESLTGLQHVIEEQLLFLAKRSLSFARSINGQSHSENGGTSSDQPDVAGMM
jgi:hypothetical protein